MTAATRCPGPDDLQHYLDEALAPDQVGTLERHVHACAACQAQMQRLVGAVGEPLDLVVPNAEAERPDLPGYLVEHLLGQGGMATVWRVWDPRLRRNLAVKVLKRHLNRGRLSLCRFVEEAHIMAQLQHPGVVPVQDVGRLADGRPYLLMKEIAGQTLASLLAERSAPTDDLPRLLQVFEQVCQTMAYVHARGVLHRDLKPGNVMIGAFGEVQVMDWGIAAPLRHEPTNEEDGGPPRILYLPVRDATQDGAVFGTYAYMAPEQARGEAGRLDPRADVFALGAILCEILTGRPPFRDRAEDRQADLEAAYDRLTHCGAEIELIGLARSCLDADRDRRPSDAGAVAARLVQQRESAQQRSRRAEIDRARAEERRLQRLLAGAVLLAVGLAAGLVWLW